MDHQLFDLSFNIGNVLTILTLLVGGVVAWQKIRDKIDEIDRRVGPNPQVTIREAAMAASALEKHDARITNLEREFSRMLGKMDLIANDTQWIRHEMEKIATRVERAETENGKRTPRAE